MARFLLSGFGVDRPGMVATVSQVLLQLGANLEDATMTRLGGQFAMLILFTVESDLDAIQTAIAPWSDLHLFVSAVDADLPLSNGGDRHLIRVSGADHPGILQGVSRYLAESSVNITDVSSRRLQGGQQAIYLLFMEVELPSELSLATLRRDLNQMQAQLGVEIQVESVEAIAL